MALRYRYKTWMPALNKARALAKAGCKVKLMATGIGRVLTNGKKGPWMSLTFSDEINVKRSNKAGIRIVRRGGMPWSRWSRSFVVSPSVRMKFSVRCEE